MDEYRNAAGGRRLKILLRLVLFFVGWCAVAVAAFVDAPTNVVSQGEALGWLTLVLVLGAALALLLRLLIRVPTPGEPSPTVALLTDEDTDPDSQLDGRRRLISAEFDNAEASYSGDEIASLLHTIVHARSGTRRVTEKLTLHDEYIVSSTIREMVLPPDPDRASVSVLVPILRSRKGIINDGVTTTAEGGSARVLTYRETIGVLAVTIDRLYRSAYVAAPSITQRQRAVVAAAWAVAFSQHRGRAARIRDVIEQADVCGAAVSPDRRSELIHLLNALSGSTFLVAHVSGAPGTCVEVTLTRSERRTDHLRGFLDQVRIFLGLRVRTYLLPLPHLFTAPSVHVEATAPDGLYLAGRQVLVQAARDTMPITPVVASAAREPIAAFSDTLGLATVHLLARDLDYKTLTARTGAPATTDPRGVRARPVSAFMALDFREVPPGLLGPITLLSSALTFLVWLIGYHHDQVFGSVDPSGAVGGKVGLVTLALSVPAILSGWLVSRFDEKALKRSSLATIIAMLTLLLISVGAVSLAAIKASVQLADTRDLDVFGVFHVHVSHPHWALLMVAALAHTLLCLAHLLARHRRYVSLLKSTPTL